MVHYSKDDNMSPGSTTFERFERLVKKLPHGWITAGCLTANLVLGELVRGGRIARTSQTLAILQSILIIILVTSFILYFASEILLKVIKRKITQPSCSPQLSTTGTGITDGRHRSIIESILIRLVRLKRLRLDLIAIGAASCSVGFAIFVHEHWGGLRTSRTVELFQSAFVTVIIIALVLRLIGVVSFRLLKRKYS